MDAGQLKLASERAQTVFDSPDGQSPVITCKSHAERRVVVVSASQVVFQVELRPSVEVGPALLVTLAEHDALPLCEIDAGSVEPHELAHAHAGQGQKVDDGKLARRLAPVAKTLHVLVADCLLHALRRLDVVYLAGGALHDVVLVLEPREEAREYAPDVVGRDLADLVRTLGRILKLRNTLSCFDAFVDDDPAGERELQNYQSHYLDLADKYRRQRDAELAGIGEDLVFEMELVREAWQRFIQDVMKKELAEIIVSQDLREKETTELVTQAFVVGDIPADGLAVAHILKPISRFARGNPYSEKCQKVHELLVAYYNRFKSVATNYPASDRLE